MRAVRLEWHGVSRDYCALCGGELELILGMNWMQFRDRATQMRVVMVVIVQRIESESQSSCM